MGLFEYVTLENALVRRKGGNPDGLSCPFLKRSNVINESMILIDIWVRGIRYGCLFNSPRR